MTDIAHQLSISTSTVISKLNYFRFKHDFSRLPQIMFWDEYAFTKGKMRFIAQDFESSISPLFLKVEHKLSSEITFFDKIEPFVVR